LPTSCGWVVGGDVPRDGFRSRPGVSLQAAHGGVSGAGQQPARAAFVAVRSGGATLTAIDDTACRHGQPACELPQQEWQVTVIVTGG
jgi:hypothetical protein